MRMAVFFLICLFGCSSFNKSHNKNSLFENKERASNYNRDNYNREYYQKNREKLKLRARERYRRNRKH